LPQYASVYFRFNTRADYVQDEWKITPKLTVNLGLRYDYLTSITPLNGRLSNDLDLFHQKYLIGSKSIPACDPNAATFVDPCIPGGIGSVPFNQNIVFTGKTSAGPPAVGDNVGPRAALAWGFAKNTVLRAGYGLYFDTVSARSQYAQNTIEGPTWPDHWNRHSKRQLRHWRNLPRSCRQSANFDNQSCGKLPQAVHCAQSLDVGRRWI
jgi:TonB dependent receptor